MISLRSPSAQRRTRVFRDATARIRLLFAVIAVGLMSAACTRTSIADVVLVHGRLFGRPPGDDGIAIGRDRIVGIGPTNSILQSAGPTTIVYDVRGHRVLPGFNDAHFHWMPRPPGVDARLSSEDPTTPELLSAITATASIAPATSWVYAAVGPSVTNDAAINRAALDRAVPDRPVWVSAWSGHGLVLNGAAMNALGLREDEPDSEGLHYDRDPQTRRLTGRFFEYEHWVQNRRLAALATTAGKLESLRAIGADAVRFGVTSVQMMATPPLDEFAAVVREANLPIRVRIMDYTLPGSPSWHSDAAQKPDRNIPAMSRVSGLKWVLDGTPVERGAVQRSGYADAPGQHGRFDLDSDKLRSVVQRAFRSDDQTLFHVVGDGAAAELFRQMEAIGPAAEWKSKRIRIEHGDGIMPDLLDQAARLGVVVVQNPAHFSLRDLIAHRLGTAAKIQPFRSLALAGIPIAIGSDGPMNPYLNLMFATTHPVNPGEAVPMPQAVDAYTRGAAFAEFAEQEKGTLAPGQLADIVVPSDDIFQMPSSALPAVHAVLTVVGGRTVFDDGTIKRQSRP